MRESVGSSVASLVRPSRLLAALLSTAVWLVDTTPARACSVGYGPPMVTRFPWFSDAAFPTNGVFTALIEWRSADGTMLELVPDEGLSELYLTPVRVPVAELPPGARYYPIETCPGTGGCEFVLQVAAEPDLEPPTAPSSPP